MTPIRLCTDPSCPEPATHRGRCADHARQQDASITRTGRKIYNSKRWKQTRRRVLFDRPLCEWPDCNRIATDVHHLIDLAQGGEPFATANLQPLCRAHHSAITRRQQTGAIP